MDRWQNHHRQLRRRWWIYISLAVISSSVFVFSFQTRNAFVFAILLLIPLLALRQAWRIDRQIRNSMPTIVTKEIS